MKKRIIILTFFIVACTGLFSQVSVSTNGSVPDNSAGLEVKSVSKGFLPPRLTTAQRNIIAAPAIGLTIYNNDINCLEFYTGTTSGWYSSCQGATTNWSLTGNTTSSLNFIGTTDNVPFNIRVNNQKAGRIDHILKNSFFGYQTGNSNTSGFENTANGMYALYSNTIGSNNEACGDRALYSNISGSPNTAVGYASMFGNTYGFNNTAIGHTSLYSNTIGNNNTAAGHGALYSNLSGNDNSGMGAGVLYSNTDGSMNTAVGTAALQNNMHAENNTAVGSYALNSNTGSYNTAIGADALKFNTTGQCNTATGAFSLLNNNGSDNAAFGYNTLVANTTGSRNSAFGSQALASNTTASNNTSIGYSSMLMNSTGHDNTACGYAALYNNTIGSFNTATGTNALYSNTVAPMNTATGTDALYSNTTGAFNTAHGYRALTENMTGSFNTACGDNALWTGYEGNYNTAMGYWAGRDKWANNTNNSSAFGTWAIVTANDMVVIGNSTITTISGQVPWATFSDARFGKNVQENVPGMAFILKLKPVSYTWDIRKLDAFRGVPDTMYSTEIMKKLLKNKELIVYSGFLAQDVEKAAAEVGFNFSGVNKPANDHTPYSLTYESFTVPLVKAVQELNEQIEMQQKMIDEEIAEIALLKERIEMLRSGIGKLKKITEKGPAKESRIALMNKNQER